MDTLQILGRIRVNSINSFTGEVKKGCSDVGELCW